VFESRHSDQILDPPIANHVRFSGAGRERQLAARRGTAGAQAPASRPQPARSALPRSQLAAPPGASPVNQFTAVRPRPAEKDAGCDGTRGEMARVAIRVLGCGDAFGSGGRLQTCFFVIAGRERFLIDCGSTAMVAMRRFGVDPATIDRVFLSHLHGDHFGGLPFLLLEAQHISRRRRPLTIVGPRGTRERLVAAQEALFPGSGRTAWRFPLEFVELEPGRTETVGGVAVTAYPVEHPSGSAAFALRFSCGGRRIAYSGDTEWTEQLIELARDSDLLIVECYAVAPKGRYHLDLETLNRRRGDLGAKRVMLTHMSQAMLEQLDGIDWETAADGLLVTI
jgi:ribonuclease BN (tRNA processing enzyme)